MAMEPTGERKSSAQTNKKPSGHTELFHKLLSKPKTSKIGIPSAPKGKLRQINIADYRKASIEYARRLAGACLVEDNFPSLMTLGVLSIFNKLLTDVKPQLQEAAAMGLLRLAKQSNAWAYCMSENGVLQTACLSYIKAKPHVRQVLLAFLTEAGRHSEEMACAVISAGAAKVAAAALIEPDDARVAAAAARLVGMLASVGRASGRALVDVGALPLLIAHLRNGSPQVQLHSARALAALSCWTPRVAEAMKPEALSSLVRRASTCGCGCRPRIPGAQWRAMAALAALAEQGPRSADRVAAIGGVPLIAAATALLGSETRMMARWAGGALLEALTRASGTISELITDCGSLLPLVAEACVLPENEPEQRGAPAALPAAQALLNIVQKSERAAAELLRACAVPRLTAAAMWTPPLPYCFTPVTEELWHTMEELSATAAQILGEIAKHSPEHACLVLNQAGPSLLHISSPPGATDPEEFGKEPELPKWCCPDGSPPRYPEQSAALHAPRRAAAQQALCRCIGQSLDLTLLTLLMGAPSAMVRRAARAQVLLLTDESPIVRRICLHSNSPTLEKLRRATDAMVLPTDSIAMLRGDSTVKRADDTAKVGWQPHQFFDDEEFDAVEMEEGSNAKEIFQPSVQQYYNNSGNKATWSSRKAGMWPCPCKHFFVTLPPDT